MANREAAREYRKRQKKRAADERSAAVLALTPAEQVEALADWSRSTLRVPPGHPRAGEPMAIPDWALAFLADALQHRESALIVARKNAKSAVVACYLLARLVGPLAFDGWRGAVASVDRRKAGELRMQAEAIAKASALQGLEFMRSPAPGGSIRGPGGRLLEVLAADAASGHASGFDDAVIDETGLLQERDRPLVNGLRSSTSARDGRVLHLSIYGDGPFLPELIDAADDGDPAIAVHLHQADRGSALDDPAAWAKSNPGLGTIKSVEYMTDRARLAARNPADAADFRAHDLNLPQRPGVELVCTVEDWRALCEGEPPDRRGACVIGFDAGGSSSLTAAAACWPASGRLEVYAAAPVTEDFDLLERGRFDAVGARYVTLHESGELWTYHGRRTTPAADFLADLQGKLAGERVAAFGADRYRQSEVVDYMTAAKVRWPTVWRGTGAGRHADGSADVRAFQRGVLDGWLRPAAGFLLMVAAIEGSEIRRDPGGNVALDKTRQRARIDPLQAAVIAAGLALPMRNRPKRRRRHAVAG